MPTDQTPEQWQIGHWTTQKEFIRTESIENVFSRDRCLSINKLYSNLTGQIKGVKLKFPGARNKWSCSTFGTSVKQWAIGHGQPLFCRHFHSGIHGHIIACASRYSQQIPLSMSQKDRTIAFLMENYSALYALNWTISIKCYSMLTPVCFNTLNIDGFIHSQCWTRDDTLTIIPCDLILVRFICLFMWR